MSLMDSNSNFHRTTHPFDNPSKWIRKYSTASNLSMIVARRPQDIDLSTDTIELNASDTKRFEISREPKSVDGHSRQELQECRVPMATLKAQKAFTSSCIRQEAVLPKRRRRAFVGERCPKRLCSPGARCESIDGENTLRRKLVDAKSCNEYNGAKEPQGDKDTISEVIESEKLFQQLDILKRGGYWKYLLGNTRDDEFFEGDDISYHEDRMDRIGKEENKENVRRACHPNIQTTSTSVQGGWRQEEDDFREQEFDHNSIGPFVGSAFTVNNKISVVDGSIAFRVHQITEDGWMCCLERFLHCACNINGHHVVVPIDIPRHSLVLLHLPRRVAALGRQGMVVRGIDLMKRRDNGALEPHTHNSSVFSIDPLVGYIS